MLNERFIMRLVETEIVVYLETQWGLLMIQ